MTKKWRVVSLIIIVALGLLLTNNISLALNAPQNPHPTDVGEGSAKLAWDWTTGGGGTIKQFKILFRAMVPPYTWEARYPTADSNSYILMGLTGNTIYEWRIKAEAVNPSNDSDYVDGEGFTTLGSSVNGDNDNDNGNHDGNDGWIPPINLRNPLEADNLWDALDAIIDFLLLLAFVIGPILIIYAAFLMMFKGQDPAALNRARATILGVLIAIALMLFAKGLPYVIKGALGG